MKKLFKSKNYPLIILIVIIVFSIVEEILIGEGGMGLYLLMPSHKILRFSIRSIYAVVLLMLGYSGLKRLEIKWITALWGLWYLIAFLIVSIRILINIKFPLAFRLNFWNFCIPFYGLLLTPFPYLFLLLLNYLFRQKGVK